MGYLFNAQWLHSLAIQIDCKLLQKAYLFTLLCPIFVIVSLHIISCVVLKMDDVSLCLAFPVFSLFPATAQPQWDDIVRHGTPQNFHFDRYEWRYKSQIIPWCINYITCLSLIIMNTIGCCSFKSNEYGFDYSYMIHKSSSFHVHSFF